MDMSQPLQITNKSRLDLASLKLLQKKHEEEAKLFGQSANEPDRSPPSPESGDTEMVEDLTAR